MDNELIEKLNRLEKLVADGQNLQKNVLSFAEAVKFLNVSASYLYKLTSQHEIPHSKPRGKMLYFDRQELETWLLQNRITTKQEIEQQANDYCVTSRRG
jgi:excisionase family DNA binding protein